MAKEATQFFQQHLAPTMDRLHARWHDEKEYEDWKEYEEVVRTIFKDHPKITLLKIQKTPFTVRFSSEGKVFVAKCAARRIVLDEVA